MPNPPQPDPEAALRKLGQRLRAGTAAQHPMAERSRQTVQAAIRANHDQQQSVPRQPSPPSPGRQGPDLDR